MTETSPRLRISHVTIQAHLVWDDGEELSPGPELQPFDAPASKAAALLAGMPAEVAQLQEQLASQAASGDLDPVQQ